MQKDYVYHQGFTRENRIAEFWKRVDKNGPVPEHLPELGPCWIWKGSFQKNGYGRFYGFRTTMAPHRFSMELHLGRTLQKPYVCHRCDNPKCVNPEHLFEGDARDNNADMTSKGRSNRVGWPTKSSVIEVKAMRVLWKSGEFTMANISRLFQVPVKRVESAIYKWKKLIL